MFSYTALGLIFYFGASQFKIAQLLQEVGGVWLGIALLIFGVLMLDVIKINGLNTSKLTEKFGSKDGKKRYWDALLLGVLFALAFCPYSGVLYFGALIPMTMVFILVFANWGAPAIGDTSSVWYYIFSYKWYITGALSLADFYLDLRTTIRP